MTDLRQAAQQALDALIDAANVLSAPMFADAVAALRTALEQSDAGIPVSEKQPEPVLSRWIGCGECDRTFKCYGGGKECIRLPAEQQAEPVAELQQVGPVEDMMLRRAALRSAKIVFAGRFVTKQAEPVAYYHPHKGFYWAKPTYISAPIVVDVPPVPLYVKWIAAQRPWQGLEAEDLAQIESDEFWQTGNHMAIAMAVEAKLKEKNT